MTLRVVLLSMNAVNPIVVSTTKRAWLNLYSTTTLGTHRTVAAASQTATRPSCCHVGRAVQQNVDSVYEVTTAQAFDGLVKYAAHPGNRRAASRARPPLWHAIACVGAPAQLMLSPTTGSPASGFPVVAVASPWVENRTFKPQVRIEIPSNSHLGVFLLSQCLPTAGVHGFTPKQRHQKEYSHERH